jgi:S1-C subfamily serine protease
MPEGTGDVSATECLAASLSLDCANAATRQQILPLLKKLGMADEATTLEKSAAETGVIAAYPELPKLKAPDANAPALSAARLYELCAPSVTLIVSGDASGAGVCIAPGLVLTSRHVLNHVENIQVYPFVVKDGKTSRLERITAQMVYENVDEDIAVIRLSHAPDTLKPLPMVTQNPPAGSVVYAIGNPGMGQQLLELSVSDGIISSNDRVVRGHHYLQHTAAVNPGNSGGPLLDETGAIVGIVCLQAHLENVSFATPAQTIRDLLGPRAR